MTGSSLTLPVKRRHAAPRALQAERQVRRTRDRGQSSVPGTECGVGGGAERGTGLTVGWGGAEGGMGWGRVWGGARGRAKRDHAVGQVGPQRQPDYSNFTSAPWETRQTFYVRMTQSPPSPLWPLHRMESEGWGALKTLDPALSPSSSFLMSISPCPGSLAPPCPVMRHQSSWHRGQRTRQKGHTGRATCLRSQKLL